MMRASEEGGGVSDPVAMMIENKFPHTQFFSRHTISFSLK